MVGGCWKKHIDIDKSKKKICLCWIDKLSNPCSFGNKSAATQIATARAKNVQNISLVLPTRKDSSAECWKPLYSSISASLPVPRFLFRPSLLLCGSWQANLNLFHCDITQQLCSCSGASPLGAPARCQCSPLQPPHGLVGGFPSSESKHSALPLWKLVPSKAPLVMPHPPPSYVVISCTLSSLWSARYAAAARFSFQWYLRK